MRRRPIGQYDDPPGRVELGNWTGDRSERAIGRAMRRGACYGCRRKPKACWRERRGWQWIDRGEVRFAFCRRCQTNGTMDRIEQRWVRRRDFVEAFGNHHPQLFEPPRFPVLDGFPQFLKLDPKNDETEPTLPL